MRSLMIGLLAGTFATSALADGGMVAPPGGPPPAMRVAGQMASPAGPPPMAGQMPPGGGMGWHGDGWGGGPGGMHPGGPGGHEGPGGPGGGHSGSGWHDMGGGHWQRYGSWQGGGGPGYGGGYGGYGGYGWQGGAGYAGGANGYRHYGRGGTVPRLWLDNRFYVTNWFAYGLTEPAYGYRWVRYYDDALLIALTSGLVYDAVYQVDWNRSYGAPGGYFGYGGGYGGYGFPGGYGVSSYVVTTPVTTTTVIEDDYVTYDRVVSRHRPARHVVHHPRPCDCSCLCR